MKVCTNDIWEEFSLPLKKFIRNRVSNDQDVDDILQEVFLKIHNNVDSLMNENKINAWVFRITRNTIVDYYRTKASFEFVEMPDNLMIEDDEDLSFNSEMATCLKKMIDGLPEKYKEAVLLTEYQNLTIKEISEKTGLSISGAKSRVQRGKKILKRMLLGCCHLEFDRLGNIIEYTHRSSECPYCKETRP
ncbi:MAG: RNA polymerase sigma factor SigZ [Firmicutes bacterium HGW-Firmicutes-12]|jgi:RNA polymerase sigma-70 factor (ECF subfamily)|nr:MAG: RNA polymerase sigma factor SigZ [Firmicutes bacterium HGW-Firmicutes-12]